MTIMKEEIVIAGFGGQGVLSMGKILAYSGLMEDKEVTCIIAPGAAMGLCINWLPRLLKNWVLPK